MELGVYPATRRIADRQGSENAIRATIIAALAYADLFDYPLTLAEIERYQIGTSFTSEQLAQVLNQQVLHQNGHAITGVATDGAFYALAGREGNFATRRERLRDSKRLWRRAAVYSLWASRLPYVRMVAVTGALAVNNIAANPDIDLLVVATAGRVWMCRRALIVLVRLARLLGDDLCPNYIVSESNLALDQRDFFTAHELAQMVPQYGAQTYEAMIRSNDWVRFYLPRGFDSVPAIEKLRVGGARRMVERAAKGKTFDRLEAWELRRLHEKLRASIGAASEVVCSPEQCKGHTGLHRRSVMMRFAARLEELELYERYAPFLVERSISEE